MCGIVGYVGKEECADILVDALSKLEYRGYDSAGIAVSKDGVISTKKTQGKIADFRAMLERDGKPGGCTGIGHTRWATHGEPSDINSHPHGNANVTIVHNGIIENYLEIKKFLVSKGYEFESETDTETVAKLLDYYYQGDAKQAIIKVLAEIRGSYALGILFKDYPDTVFAVRKDSPLLIGVGSGENFIASDMTALLKHTRNYYLLNTNEIATLKADSVEICDIHGNAVEKELNTATWDESAAEKGGYEHFMLKEINEQPIALKTTITPRILKGMPYLAESGVSDTKLKNYRKIHIVACGTAMHAGMVGKYIIEKIARVEVAVDIASEFRYRNPILSKDDLVIVISQSGETADTKAALELAKDFGADTMAIVNVKGSSIAREADTVIYTHAGPEISVASTKAYTVQLSVMYLLAFELAYVRGVITKEECEEFTKTLEEIPDVIRSVIDSVEAQCQYAASKIVNTDSLLYIGRGLDYALSMEGSLKLKEISYIHCEAYAAGELKHGTISLIEQGMPVIAVATQTALIEKTISNVKEVKSRGAMVILIAKEGEEIEEGIAEVVIRLPRIRDTFMPILSAVPLQFIAYYTSILKGLNVDQPRNLAKSVTVE